ncbi:MAG TPA: NAD(P)/FAD-dependent oxidoreductase [Methanoculleus sp.]|nr:NAD(P)/FAD-dependent oxidoreductase [Methanoculleus sp.]
MNICIIGSGLTGLVAAYHLSNTADVEILERSPDIGGCLASYDHGPDTAIEKFYHHCFSGDKYLFQLLEEIGIRDRLAWRKGSTGYYVDGAIYPLTTPVEILRYPHLSLVDKIRLGLLVLGSRTIDAETLDDIPARVFAIRRCGEHAYTSFFEPLLRSKFGDMHDQVSAAWLMSRVSIRSNRGVEGERLGYLDGGFQVLIDRLEEDLTARGCIIRRETAATALRRTGEGWQVNGSPCDAVISTISPAALQAIGGPELAPIPYQGAACMTLGLAREVTDGIYWVNMKGDAPYGAVIGHTNFIADGRYGEHIVYLASYYRGSVPERLEERMLADFRTRFGVGQDEIHWHRLAIEDAAGPVYTTGYRRLIQPYARAGLYLAGMFSAPNYPERSMEGAVIAGRAVAREVLGTVA